MGKTHKYILRKQNGENSEMLEEIKANELTTRDGQEPLTNVGGEVMN